MSWLICTGSWYLECFAPIKCPPLSRASNIMATYYADLVLLRDSPDKKAWNQVSKFRTLDSWLIFDFRASGTCPSQLLDSNLTKDFYRSLWCQISYPIKALVFWPLMKYENISQLKEIFPPWRENMLPPRTKYTIDSSSAYTTGRSGSTDLVTIVQSCHIHLIFVIYLSIVHQKVGFCFNVIICFVIC